MDAFGVLQTPMFVAVAALRVMPISRIQMASAAPGAEFHLRGAGRPSGSDDREFVPTSHQRLTLGGPTLKR